MKRLTALVVLVLFMLLGLVGCTEEYTPDPMVEQYLNSELSGQKAYDSLKTAHYITDTIVQTKQGVVKGTEEVEVFLDMTDGKNLVLEMHQVFTGDRIKDGVTKVDVLLKRIDGKYIYSATTVTTEQKTTDTEMEDADAEKLVCTFIYNDNGAYDEGGLYYGDLFMIRIYKFPPESFFIDEENDLCVFNEKMVMEREDTGKVRLYQTSKINRLGLLVYEYEKYESVDDDVVMILEMKPEYEFVTEQK